MFAGEFEGADARMRIGPVPHSAVLLAFPDSADLDQNRRRPPFGRPEGWPPLFHRQHRFAPKARDTNPLGARRSVLLTQGRDSESPGLRFPHGFPRLSFTVARSWKP